MSDALKPLINKAADAPLSRAEAEAAFDAIMSGEATPAQMGGFLMALRARGETVDGDGGQGGGVHQARDRGGEGVAGAADRTGARREGA